MLSNQPNAEPTSSASDLAHSSSTNAGIPRDELQDGEEQGASMEAMRLLPGQIREVVRLFQCPKCSYTIEEPTTLPCGRTLCKKCLPEPYVRPHISYPQDESRHLGLKCPFPECDKEHAVRDCSADVVLSKILSDTKLGIEQGKATKGSEQYSVTITIESRWPPGGISVDGARRSKAAKGPQIITGGRFLATYTLMEQGDLDYYSEVTYDVVGQPQDGEKLDLAVLDDVKQRIRLEVDCHICYGMLYDPLTTSCGHTFCRHCLQRVLDHAAQCPVCRRTLQIPSADRETCPSNSLIKRTCTAFWSDDLKVRKEAIAAEQSVQTSTDFDSAIFVCALAFPEMPTFLHVFEPRYRLMIRRALEADRTFGIVLHQSASIFGGGPTIASMGTTLRITNVEFFNDGRSLIETTGVGRFRILRSGMLDGYMVAQTEKINDISVAEEEELEAYETGRAIAAGRQSPRATPGSNLTEEDTAVGQQPQEQRASDERHQSDEFRRPIRPEDLEAMPTRELMSYACDFVGRMRTQSVTWLATRILAIYGECPSDPAVFPWWLASILPVRDEEKYRLLATTSVRARLQVCCRWIMEWENTRW